LRKLADETRNHDLERDLYIEERNAERGIKHAQYWPTKGFSDRWRLRVFDSPIWYAVGSVIRTDWRKVPPVLIKLIDHWSWIIVMFLYWLLADYGRSFRWPIITLVSSVFVFYWAYVGVLETPKAEYVPDFRNAVWAYAIANAVPFVGSLTLEKEVKTTLLCGGRADLAAPRGTSVCTPVPPPSVTFQFITIIQSIFSAICVFFAGLALRNYFKLR
jgi:hypothetical protein